MQVAHTHHSSHTAAVNFGFCQEQVLAIFLSSLVVPSPRWWIFTATVKKKYSNQASLKPVLEVPGLGARCCWALMSSLGEGVRRGCVNVSDTESQAYNRLIYLTMGGVLINPPSTHSF